MLVSEVMLQQTPVVRVEPVFRAWVDRWSTPAALAAESSGEAICAWGRLGYPRRALRLWQAAVVLRDSFQGRVPDDLPALLSLPGVGQYTARAVLAFGFGRRVPVVDTNVQRVLNRAVRGNDDAGAATTRDLLLLDEVLPQDEAIAAQMSISLMELGALVCTKRQPRCPECPLLAQCAWVRAGSPSSAVTRRAQPWHGTDRQVRGRLLAVLRRSAGQLSIDALRFADVSDEQWRSCLDSLLHDGLAVVGPDGRWSLPD